MIVETDVGLLVYTLGSNSAENLMEHWNLRPYDRIHAYLKTCCVQREM